VRAAGKSWVAISAAGVPRPPRGAVYTRTGVLGRQFAEGLRELVIPRPILDWLQEEVVASEVSQQAAREQTVRRARRNWSAYKTAWMYSTRTDSMDASAEAPSALSPVRVDSAHGQDC